jgi:hypothetical protein
MSDIDFDELDRAVSGALNGTSPSTEATPPSVLRTERTSLTPASSSTYGSPSAYSSAPLVSPSDPPVVAPVASTPTTASAPALAARRSSGRFMDMVHPSSDMRTSTTGSAPTTPTPTPTPTTRPQPTVLHQPTRPPVQPPAPAVSAPVMPEAPAWNEPLESPFLPDAKVEKRPLGGTATDTSASNDDDVFDFQGLLDEPKEHLLEAPEPPERLEAVTMPDPIDFAAAAAINEAIESQGYEDEEEVVAEPQVPVKPEIFEAPAAVTLATAPSPVDEQPIGPTSITPQYKEQPSSNQETGPMYDTESYYQPVAAPIKRKSGWLNILWIVLLVALGAGLGYVGLMFVMPML